MIIFGLVLLLGKKFSKGQESRELSTKTTWWEVQSIDTMKYSRDLALLYKDSNALDESIKQQVAEIAEIGATHVAVATPYDSEFLPFLEKWVRWARENNLKVWFRGNWSGWEGWFDYEKITPQKHILLTKNFIINNRDIFEDGDIFTACPECENGVIGDPRQEDNRDDFINFMLSEKEVVDESFQIIGKNVVTNFFSMNADVAKLVMDKVTSEKLGGVVTIDHYVGNPEMLVNDVSDIARKSSAKVVLGEFGAPIPAIHGIVDEKSQAGWISDSLYLLSQTPDLIGINYWVNVGGSTQLWDEKGNPREAVGVIESYFKPKIIDGRVKNIFGTPIAGARVSLGHKTSKTDKEGNFNIAYVPSSASTIKIAADGYSDETVEFFSQSNSSLEVKLKSKSGYLSQILVFFRYYLRI